MITYVEGDWRVKQRERPDSGEFVFAGKTRGSSVKYFIVHSAMLFARCCYMNDFYSAVKTSSDSNQKIYRNVQ